MVGFIYTFLNTSHVIPCIIVMGMYLHVNETIQVHHYGTNIRHDPRYRRYKYCNFRCCMYFLYHLMDAPSRQICRLDKILFLEARNNSARNIYFIRNTHLYVYVSLLS